MAPGWFVSDPRFLNLEVTFWKAELAFWVAHSAFYKAKAEFCLEEPTVWDRTGFWGNGSDILEGNRRSRVPRNRIGVCVGLRNHSLEWYQRFELRTQYFERQSYAEPVFWVDEPEFLFEETKFCKAQPKFWNSGIGFWKASPKFQFVESIFWIIDSSFCYFAPVNHWSEYWLCLVECWGTYSFCRIEANPSTHKIDFASTRYWTPGQDGTIDGNSLKPADGQPVGVRSGGLLNTRESSARLKWHFLAWIRFLERRCCALWWFPWFSVDQWLLRLLKKQTLESFKSNWCIYFILLQILRRSICTTCPALKTELIRAGYKNWNPPPP